MAEDDYVTPPQFDTYLEEDAGPNRRITVEYTTDQGTPVKHTRRRVTLVLFSGGIDSTYALVKILKDCDDIVIAHHVHMMNRENRFEEEAIACRNIVDYCKAHFRDFYFTETTVDRRRFQSTGYDLVVASFEAGIVVQSFYADTGMVIDRWVTGGNAEDCEIPEDGIDTMEEKYHAMLLAMQACCHPLTPPYLFNLPLKPKAAFIDYLGKNLANLCWTCSTPVKHIGKPSTECGTCHTCILMNDIRSNHQPS